MRGVAERLARLPIRSIQVSLDGDTQEVYERQRPAASLAKAHAACRAVRDAGLPLEVTLRADAARICTRPARSSRARASWARSASTTGRLMRIGTAARHWEQTRADARSQYRDVSRRARARTARL